MIQLRDVLRLSGETVELRDPLVYSQLTAQPDGGIVVKTMRRGVDFPDKPQLIARAGQFMIARSQPQKGLWGFVPRGIENPLIASSYHLFDLDPAVDQAYFAAYTRSSRFGRAVFEAAHKSGRLYLRQFGAIPLWLPSLAEQARIVDLLNAGQAILAHTQAMMDALRQIKQSVAADLLTQANPSWESATLGAYATLIREGAGLFPLVVTSTGRLLQNAALEPGAVAILPHAELSLTFLIAWLEHTLSGVIMPPRAGWESLPLLLPTFYEQQKFALVLVQHDEAIAALQVEYAAIESLVISVQDHIFGGAMIDSRHNDTNQPRWGQFA